MNLTKQAEVRGTLRATIDMMYIEQAVTKVDNSNHLERLERILHELDEDSKNRILGGENL